MALKSLNINNGLGAVVNITSSNQKILNNQVGVLVQDLYEKLKSKGDIEPLDIFEGKGISTPADTQADSHLQLSKLATLIDSI